MDEANRPIIEEGLPGFEICFGHNHYQGNFEFLRKKEIVKNSTKLKWRKGDIIIFNSGFLKMGDWRDWFLKEEDKHKHCSINYSVPRYAGKKLAMVIERYRWVKIKPTNTYRDYGKVLLLLNGSKKGKMRKFMSTTPFKLFSKFPHDNLINLIRKHPDNKLLKDVSTIPLLDTNENTRNMFIEQVKTLI